MTLTETLVVIAIGAVVLGLTLAAVQTVRETSQRSRCLNNLRQLGLAAQHYHSVSHSFPPGVTLPPLASSGAQAPRLYDPFPLMGWHVRLLPYLEQQALWDEVRQAYRADDRGLNDPPHTARKTPVEVFVCPSDGRRSAAHLPPGASPATISYLGVAGVTHQRADGVLFLDSRVRTTQILDGASNTLLAGERPPSQDLQYGVWYPDWGHWWAGNTVLGVRDEGFLDWEPGCSPGPYSFGRGALDNPCDSFHFWSTHRGGAHFLFADGSARFLSYSAAPFLPALATRAGNDRVSLPD